MKGTEPTIIFSTACWFLRLVLDTIPAMVWNTGDRASRWLPAPLYGDSGIMTFIMSREGVVYQADLGKNTADVAASIKEYNPTDEWSPVE